MNMLDARRTFKDVRVVHLGSILPTGWPHVVPLWFVWLEDALYVTCRRGSRVWRNLLRDPRVALELERGQAWTEQAGALVHGLAEPLDHEEDSAKRALSAWFEKYRAELGGLGFAAYTDQVQQPVVFRVRPDRLATWIHAHTRPG